MKFKVYVDYTTEEVPRPYYVGKGTLQRLKIQVRNKLHTSICNKYGFERRVIIETDDEQEAFAKERELILAHDTYVYGGGWGANFTLGGEGGSGMKYPDRKGEKCPMWGKKHSEESKQKNSESNKIAQAGDKNAMFGKHHSEETKRKIGDNQRGWHHTDKAKEKLAESAKRIHTGRKRSDESRKKMSEARKGKKPWNKGKVGLQKSHMKGRKLSEETKRKIAESRKGQTPWNKGKKIIDEQVDDVSKEELATLAAKIL